MRLLTTGCSSSRQMARITSPRTWPLRSWGPKSSTGSSSRDTSRSTPRSKPVVGGTQDVEPFHIVGAGGIGCAVGYVLRAAGTRVIFVDVDVEKVRWGRSHGVRVDQRPPLPAEFLTFDEWVPPAGAMVLLCTK